MATRLPGVLANISDKAVRSASTDAVKVLLIGIKLPAGTLAVNTPTPITSEGEALEAAGEGSQLVQMVRASRAQNSRIDMTIVAVDPGAGAAATGTYTFAGAATTANPVIFRVGDVQITVPVVIGDDGTDIALAASTELAKAEFAGLHVTAAPAAAILTLTAKSVGIHGNSILLKVVSEPPGVTAVAVQMASGTLAPDVDGALQSLGLVRYNYIALPDTDTTTLADTIVFLKDLWQPDQARDGHAIAALRDSVGNLSTFGLGVDTKQITVFGNPVIPSNPWIQAAAVCAARATQLNPVFALYSDDLAITAPDETDRLTNDELTTLLDAGLAVYHYVQDTPRVLRFLTLQKTNDLGQPTEAFLDAETKFTVSAYRQETILTLQGEIGKVLVDDASSVAYAVGVSQNITDPNRIRQLLIAQYSLDVGNFQSQGWVDEPDAYAASLTVDKTGPNSVEIFSTPIINGTAYDFTQEIEFALNT